MEIDLLDVDDNINELGDEKEIQATMYHFVFRSTFWRESAE